MNSNERAQSLIDALNEIRDTHISLPTMWEQLGRKEGVKVAYRMICKDRCTVSETAIYLGITRKGVTAALIEFYGTDWDIDAEDRAVARKRMRPRKDKLLIYVHTDGRVFKGTQWEFHRFAGKSARPSDLALGRRFSADGWRLGDTDPLLTGKGANKGADHHAFIFKTWVFLHEDGRKFEGTKMGFERFSGVNHASVHLLIHNEQASTHGWYLEGTDPPIKKSYRFTNRFTGEIFDGTRTQLHRSQGLMNSDIQAIISGSTRSGWASLCASCRALSRRKTLPSKATLEKIPCCRNHDYLISQPSQ